MGGMYPAERAPNHLLFDEAISPRTSIWADIEVCIVCKDNMADPFDYIDPEGMADAKVGLRQNRLPVTSRYRSRVPPKSLSPRSGRYLAPKSAGGASSTAQHIFEQQPPFLRFGFLEIFSNTFLNNLQVAEFR